MSSSGDSDGLSNLEQLADQLDALPQDKSVPIVFVPGFAGWGSPLFGAVNYWGGIDNVPGALMARGYTLIISPIAPLSSNWERACELYRLLTIGKFSLFNATTNEIDDTYDVDVDYGSYFEGRPDKGPLSSKSQFRKRAILFTATAEKYAKWKWSEKNKVHFICHSQGGTTVRYLISLMANGSGGLHRDYFTIEGRDNWAVSVTTLGTPHRGTTVIDVFENMIPQSYDRLKFLARLFATISFAPPRLRAYDLQLDHWEICRKGNESFEDMRTRFELDSGPVGKWYRSNQNGFYDNCIKGVQELHQKTIPTSKNIYYFSFSFNATTPFPSQLPPWAFDSIKSFPLPLVGKVRQIAPYFPPLNLSIWLFDRYLRGPIYNLLWIVLSHSINLRDLMGWATNNLTAPFIKQIGYDISLPSPGKYIPRPDVMPPMIPFSYAMSSQALTPEERSILGNLVDQDDLGDWFKNDGIVNTASMCGPMDACVKDISLFPIHATKNDIDSDGIECGSDGTSEIVNPRGIYYHFGVNNRMDHADEIGVFISDDTSHGTRKMYFNLARLVTRLSSAV